MDGIVYLITNTINGKKYVGSTGRTLEKRFKEHTNYMSNKQINHRPLYQDMNANGVDAFTIEPIMEMKYFDIKELWLVEDAYIAIHDTIHHGYNKKYNLSKTIKIATDEDIYDKVNKGVETQNTYGEVSKRHETQEKYSQVMKRLETQKNYYEKNKEKRCEYQREYRKTKKQQQS